MRDLRIETTGKAAKCRHGSCIVMSALLVMSVSVLTACGSKEAVPVEDNKVEIVVEPISETAVTDDTTAGVTAAVTEAVKETEQSLETAQETELIVDMSKVTSIDPARTMYAVSNVNIRKGPSTEFEAVGMLKLGEEVSVIGQDADGWYEFRYEGNEVFASDDYLSDEEPALPTPTATVASEDTGAAQTEVPVDAASEAAALAMTQAVAAPVAVQAPAGVLIIGDSRCVMMRDATGGGGCSWICQNSKGYNWLESTAIPQADESIGKGTKVVICLGVNDVGNVNKYAALVNYKAAEWAARGAKTYYVSVNPVWENAYVTEEQVQYFNAQLVGQLVGIKWIDTHTYLMNSGYRLTDGLHFDNETSLRIFQTIIGSL